MPIFYINSLAGRIGPFWWVNADCASFNLLNATYMGSIHRVWREGTSGWGYRPGRFIWRTIP
jgi:hypothetical protein